MGTLEELCDLSEDDYARNMLDDLQLAAELGKTLLERNKELENALKQHQTAHEDQAQEIEYLTKQNVALREVNESRMRIYEQLEVSIQELERANHRLLLENSSNKKQIKTFKTTIEGLESKCEDLQGTIDDLNLQVDILKNRSQRSLQVPFASSPYEKGVQLRHVGEKNNTDEESLNTSSDSDIVRKESPQKKNDSSLILDDEDFQMVELKSHLDQMKAQCRRDERKIRELEEQLVALVQENTVLENQINQIHQRGNDMMSMHEELTTLEEVRQGQLCSRCLGSVDPNESQIPDDDDTSMLQALSTTSTPEQYRTSFSMEVQNDTHSTPLNKTENLYKNLAAKYEALVEVQQRQPLKHKSDHCLSLQDEIQQISGDFNMLTDEESGHGGDSLLPEKQHKITRKTFSHTPTDFSEAETSSSGFADETSNKGTQTEVRSGSILCTIADGDDCKFTIYDDANPINSRFSKHRELVNEILSALKRAVKEKDDFAEQLPAMEEMTQNKLNMPKITPQEICEPILPEDDCQSVLSSTMSELSISQNEPATVIENVTTTPSEPVTPPQIVEKTEPNLTPLVRQPLENLSGGKRSSSRRRKKLNMDRSDSPITTQIIGSPKINYAKRVTSGRNRRRLYENTENTTATTSTAWNGNTVEYWSTRKNLASPTPSQGSGKSYFEFKPSTASQDLNKLKQLDRSYAEVVRLTSKNDHQFKQRRK